jgi:chitodextrinase
VTGYRVYYRTGANSYIYVTTAGTSATLSGLLSAASYNIYVIAYDAAGNLSPSSTVLTATTLDGTAPSTPTNLASTGVTATSVSLSWTASTDNVGVSGYRVYYRTGTNSFTYTTVASNTATVTGLTSGTAYDFYVVAYDAAGNLSVSSNTISATTTFVDTTPPDQPLGLTSTGTTTSSVSLSWQAPLDNVGVTGYRVYYRTGTNAFTYVSVSTAAATVTGLLAGTSYNFYVVAYDAAGNASANSSTYTVSTQAAATPTVSVSLTGSSLSATTHRLSWSVSTTGTLQSLTLEVKKGTGAYTTIPTGTLNSTGTYDYTPGSAGKYAYRALARLSNGTSAYSNTVNLTIK